MYGGPDITKRLVETMQPGADAFGKCKYKGGDLQEQGCRKEQHQGKVKLFVKSMQPGAEICG